MGKRAWLLLRTHRLDRLWSPGVLLPNGLAVEDSQIAIKYIAYYAYKSWAKARFLSHLCDFYEVFAIFTIKMNLRVIF